MYACRGLIVMSGVGSVVDCFIIRSKSKLFSRYGCGLTAANHAHVLCILVWQ